MKYDPDNEVQCRNDKKAIIHFTKHLTQKQSNPDVQYKYEHGNHHDNT